MNRTFSITLNGSEILVSGYVTGQDEADRLIAALKALKPLVAEASEEHRKASADMVRKAGQEFGRNFGVGMGQRGKEWLDNYAEAISPAEIEEG